MIDILWYKTRAFVNNVIFSQKKDTGKRYSVAIGFIILTLLTKSFLRLWIGDVAAFHVLLIAVIFSAWYGGFGPGILTTIGIAILNYVLFTAEKIPIVSLNTLVLISIFFIEGLLISIISEVRKQTDEEKDMFIGFASHELKNPLAAVKGYISLVLTKAQKEQDVKLAHYALRLDAQANNIHLLVQELFDLTKIRAGKISYHDEPFALYDLLKNTVQDQHTATATHTIRLTGKSTKHILADKVRIAQVITNLITNAVKYSPNAKTVDVMIEDRQNQVTIIVKDYGPGIPKDQQQKIFDQFYQTKTLHKTDGLGLGLYISSIIVKHYQGKLWVKSTLGKGSQFFLELPTSD